MAADDGAAQGKVRIQILACRRAGMTCEAISNRLEPLEADQWFMMALAQRDSPIGGFDVARVDRSREQSRDFLIPHDAAARLRKRRLRFQETLHLGLELEPSAGIAFEGFLHDGGQRFIAHQQPAMTAYFLVAVADRDGEYVIATLHARLHLLQGLTSILQALQLTLRGDHGFDELAFGRVFELEVEALHGCVVSRQFLPQLQVKDRVSRKALQVIEDDDTIFLPALLQEPEHGDHAGAIHEVAAAGDIIVEYCFDLIAASSRVVPAAMLLAVQPIAIVLLLFVGHAAVDDGFSVYHGLGFLLASESRF